MVLSDRDIKKYLASGKLKISPEPDLSVQLGACCLDLHLGNIFRVYNQSSVAVIDPFDKDLMDKLTSLKEVEDSQAFILHPGEFVLAVTKEYISLPDDLSARLEGRSSIGRLGVVIHSTAGNIESGFRGQITLELANMGRIPVKLYPGMRICALSFDTLSTPSEVPYYRKKGAKYLDQNEPGVSRIAQERKKY